MSNRENAPPSISTEGNILLDYTSIVVEGTGANLEVATTFNDDVFSRHFFQ